MKSKDDVMTAAEHNKLRSYLKKAGMTIAEVDGAAGTAAGGRKRSEVCRAVCSSLAGSPKTKNSKGG